MHWYTLLTNISIAPRCPLWGKNVIAGLRMGVFKGFSAISSVFIRLHGKQLFSTCMTILDKNHDVCVQGKFD